MKSVLIRELFLEIKSTLGRFIAIFAIVALGVGFFAGLRGTTPDMKDTADVYYKENNMMDIRLLSTMGFTEDDVAALKEQPGIQAVQPTYSTDALVDMAGVTRVAKVHAMDISLSADDPRNMNRPVLVEGRWPQQSGECLLDAHASTMAAAANIGDTIAISADNEQSTQDLFGTKQFKVVGMVNSPYYISFQRGNTSIGNGKISAYIIVPQQDFASEYYLELFATVDGAAALPSYSDAYKDLIASYMDALQPFADERAALRYQQVQQEGNEKIADAQAELNDAKQKLADGKKEFATAHQEFADAQKKFADGKAEAEQKLADARQEIADGESKIETAGNEIAANEAKLNNGEADYASSQKEYEDKIATGQAEIDAAIAALAPQKEAYEKAAKELATAQQQYSDLLVQIEQLTQAGMLEQAAALQAQADKIKPELDTKQNELAATAQQIGAAQAQIDAAQATLDAAKAQGGEQLAQARATLDEGWAKLRLGKAQLAQAKQDLAKGKETYAEKEAEAEEEIASAQAKLDDAQLKLDDAQKELADGQKKIDDGNAKLQDARQKLADLKPTEWYVLDRNTNPGYVGYGSDADRIAAISTVFPIFFFLVAALVCLTTMTRMVEEQRTQIGVLKALGYSKAAVASKYIVYALVASLLGSVVGLLVGFWVFPTAVFHAYGILYTLPPIRIGFHWDLALLASGAAVASTVLAALAACINELQAVPAQLIRPKAPPAGRRVFLERIPAIWKRMKFTSKVTVRNLFRYKKRFFMTIIGIAGCSALMLTGFGLRDSIAGIVSHQFSSIHHYDAMMTIENAGSAQADDEINSMLNKLTDEFIYVEQPPITAKKAGDTVEGYLIVPEDTQQLNHFIRFNTRETGQPVAFPQPGKVVVTEKLATTLHLQPGDRFTLVKGDTDQTELIVGSITENYIYNYVYIAPEDYAAAFGQPEYKEIFFNVHAAAPGTGKPLLSETEEADLSTKLLDVSGVESVAFTTKISRDFGDIMGSLDSVVWMLILCANLLAFIVLYNLVNINITERMRELATIKVLGFYNKEVSAYVYRENILLTAIGVVCGLVGGIFLHQFVITTAEVDMVMFERSILLQSYLYAVALTFGFAFVVNFIMSFRLKKISMVESLKSAE